MTTPITMDTYSTAFLIICINTAMSIEYQNGPEVDTDKYVSTSYRYSGGHIRHNHNRSARRTPSATFNDLVICTLPDGTCYQNKACRSQYWGANRQLWTECPCGNGYTRQPYHCNNYQTKCNERIQDFGCSWILECYLEVDMDENESYRYEKHGECHVNIGIVIGLAIGLVCIIILIVLVILYFKRRKDDRRSTHIMSKDSSHSFLSSQQSIPLKHGDGSQQSIPLRHGEVRPPEGPRRKRSYTPPRGSRHGSTKGTPPPIRRHHNSSFSSRTGSPTQTTSLHSPLTSTSMHSPLSPMSPLTSSEQVHMPLRAGEVQV